MPCPEKPFYNKDLWLAVQGVSSEPVSGGWAPNSLLNREKTGNFSESGRYGGIFGRINSLNQLVNYVFPKNRNREFNWRIREFFGRIREFGIRARIKQTGPSQAAGSKRMSATTLTAR